MNDLIKPCVTDVAMDQELAEVWLHGGRDEGLSTLVEVDRQNRSSTCRKARHWFCI